MFARISPIDGHQDGRRGGSGMTECQMTGMYPNTTGGLLVFGEGDFFV